MSTEKKYLLVFVENLEKLAFFSRLYPAFRDRGYGLLVVSNRVSVILQARRHGMISRLCRRDHRDVDLSGTLELLRQDLTEHQAENFYGGILKCVEQAADSIQLCGGLIWNGGRLADWAIADYCNERGLNCLFFEIGNIPGKMIADPMGVNARSLLAGKGFRQEYQPTPSFDSWRKSYIATKLQQRSVPQARSVGQINPFYLIDLLGFLLLAAPRNTNRSVKAMLKNVFLTRSVALTTTETVPETRFFFLPLQVTNDTQLFLNSKVDNRGALEFALHLCKEEQAMLVVKPHPAETSPQFLAWLQQFAQENNIQLSRANTMELISKSDRVITINSTVGLEALLYGREVEVLGNAVYKGFGEADLDRYVNRYLLNIDYFSRQEIAAEAVNEIEFRLFTGSIDCVNP
jgi:capsular polysaccharide export protein